MANRPPHHSDRFAGDNPLAHGAVDPGKTGKKGMISLAMFDDQEFTIPAELAGINDAPLIRRHHLCAGGGFHGHSLSGQPCRQDLAETPDDAPGDGRRQFSPLAADRSAGQTGRQPGHGFAAWGHRSRR